MVWQMNYIAVKRHVAKDRMILMRGGAFLREEETLEAVRRPQPSSSRHPRSS